METRNNLRVESENFYQYLVNKKSYSMGAHIFYKMKFSDNSKFSMTISQRNDVEIR